MIDVAQTKLEYHIRHDDVRREIYLFIVFTYFYGYHHHITENAELYFSFFFHSAFVIRYFINFFALDSHDVLKMY